MAKPNQAGLEIDQPTATRLLETLFDEAVAIVEHGAPDTAPDEARALAATIFASAVQSYREALLGCAIARLVEPNVDVTRPYTSHGDGAFSGRTLDERVINPFLKIRQVPSTKGAYLAIFRRSVRFDAATGAGLRDRTGYQAMLDYLALLAAADPEACRGLARHLCVRFVILRAASTIDLVRIIRMTLDQLATVIRALLRERSGGRFPVFLVAAMFEAIRDRFGAAWDVEVQGINAADAATGAGGDVVIREAGAIVLAVEVTERPIEEPRVVATFVSKISPARIADYLFVHGAEPPTAAARRAAFGYFAQGHDIAFVPVEAWLTTSLATIGSAGRQRFIEHFLARLAPVDVPVPLKLRWNDLVRGLAGVPVD